MLKLPSEIVARIAMFSTSAVAATLAGNRANHAWIQPDLDKRAAKQLMEYVLNPTPANIAKAKAMIAANPKIMFIRTQGYETASGIEEYFDATGQAATRAVHRKIIGSPFQAALGAGDKELYKYMAKYFDRVEDGVALAQNQIQERFPNGFDYPASDYDFSTIINAITNDQTLASDNNPSDATQKTLKKLRKDFLPTDVTQGHHFNLNHLVKAFDTYNQQFNNWNWNQRSLFWCQVIGYLERFVPVVDAQAFCQGLYYLLEQKQLQARALSLYNYQSSSDITYYPVNSTPAGLGFDFGIVVSSAPRPGVRGGVGDAAPRVWAGAGILKNYVEQKHQNLATFSSALSSGLTQQAEPNSTRCTIL
jgi:hypothetical protein